MADKEFAHFLEELIARHAEAEAVAAPPGLAVDLLNVVEAIGLEAGWSRAEAVSHYRESAARIAIESEAASLLDAISVVPMPSIDPDEIARELGLAGRRVSLAGLDQLRRTFAAANHPDRAAPQLRERAAIRMQIANRLIDEAKKAERLRLAGQAAR
jgi:hypothetical protein